MFLLDLRQNWEKLNHLFQAIAKLSLQQPEEADNHADGMP